MTPQEATPPQTAEELVAAIRKEASHITGASMARRELSLARIAALATRLAPLLAEQDAAAGDMLAALDKALPILSALVAQKGLEPSIKGYESGGWVAKEAVRAALARVEGDK